ncbi:MAG: transporter [Caldilineaceae bacterium]|nr:transporter [Caldilineaceae bacterium]
MLDFLSQQPLILFFLIAALGYLLGQIKILGSNLGIAAVLFVGLAFGALDERFKLPEILYHVGLVLFVYCIGLSSGRAFFRALRSGGVRANLLVVTMLMVAAGFTVLSHRFLGLLSAQSAGLYAGSLTNTPALAAILETIRHTAPAEQQELLLTQPVVGYSIAYPVGVLGMILAIAVAQRWLQPNYRAEARALRHLGGVGEELVSHTVRVTNPDVMGQPVSALLESQPRRLIFTRHKRQGVITLAKPTTELLRDDVVDVVGAPEDVEEMVTLLGDAIADPLALDRSVYDFRRVFVSSPTVIGHRLDQLDIQGKLGALVTRLRRGDMELLAVGPTVVEAGDRVRVVAPRERMQAVSDFFGDSYRTVSEIDILPFNLGIVLGLLVGAIPIPIPGSEPFHLGIAGGPLLVALILGTVERTGPLIWNIPYSANLTLRQFGVVIFLAVIGTRAGYAFVQTLLSSSGLLLFLSGAFITCSTALITLWVGSRLLKIPMSLLIGILAGLQTNPAILSYATLQTDNELPNVGYATVYPAAMIVKILVAQALLTFLR